ncbi:EcsC family protein [Cognatishimia activa]|uniref:EcsC family protein n=1 Tax=Cognatishimia activa TaxID=1715691 RepID=UPI00222F02C0|nr:EcsC family protein [Cognatishimia activa]UZD91796.1 EcsC family protein [Cognatishimia activa]
MRDQPFVIVDTEEELTRLVVRYQNAGNVGIELLNLLGAQADGLVDGLPRPVRDRLEGATEAALKQAMKAAHGSRRIIKPGQPSWLQNAVATSMGAAGGIGGVGTALAELPLTTTILLRTIQDVAEELEFDPLSENVQFDCIQVFAAAGPLTHDDNADLGFLGARMALSSGGMQKLMAWVAPRLAAVFGQKLAAQAVPVLGAAAGAATNYAFINYYREMAHVHFGLRRLSIEADLDHPELLERFRSHTLITQQD